MAVMVNDDNSALETLTQNASTNGTIDNVDFVQEEYLGWGERLNLIEDETAADRSVSGADLWATFQQNHGSANAILSSGAVAVRLNGNDGGPSADTDAAQTVSVSGRFVGDGPIVDGSSIGIADRVNVITDGAFEIAEGVVTVQQNSGDANVIGAAIGVLATDGASAVDAVVTQTVSATGTVEGPDAGSVTDILSTRVNTIDEDTFDRYRGVVNVQQNNGSAGVVGSAIGVMASVAPNAGTVVSSADVEGTVTESDVRRGTGFRPGSGGGVSRQNTIDDAFDGVEGVGTVIQNNGSSTVIGSAVAVTAGDPTADSAGTVANSATVDGAVTGADPFTVETSSRFNRIGAAFAEADGVNTVIQNNGDASAIGAAVAVAAQDAGSGTATSTATANGVVADTIVNHGSRRDFASVAVTNTIENDAFAGASGVTSVIQNHGNGSVIGSAISVTVPTSASSSSATIDADLDAATIGSAITEGVGGNTVRNEPNFFTGTLGRRTNAIDGASYRDAVGIHTIQQNAGPASRVLSAVAVQADLAAGEPTVGADAAVRGRVSDNTVTRNVAEPDLGNEPIVETARSNTILGAAFGGQSGVAAVQQNTGDANDIGAATAVDTAVGGIGDLTQSAATAGRVDDNTAGPVDDDTGADGPLTDPGLILINAIDAEDMSGPFDGFAGVVTVQQNNGVANTLGVANAVAGVAGSTGAVAQTVGSHNEPGAGIADQNVVDRGALEEGGDRSNTIAGAFNGAASGMATVQQNNGDANVIGAGSAVLGLPTANDATTGGGDVTQSAIAGTGVLIDTVDADAITPRRDNRIDQSFSAGAGIFAVQQNNGNANVLALANAAVAVGDDGFGNLTQVVEAGGDMVNVDAYFLDGRYANTIAGDSFDGAAGWISVQQNTGDANIVAAATAVATATGPLDGATTNQTVRAGGDVGTVQTFDDSSGFTIGDPQPRRDNLIENAFDMTGGVATVQQNSGNANVLSAALGVVTPTGQGPLASATQTVSADGAIADADTPDTVIDYGSNRTNEIDNGFNDVDGVFTVQQNTGDGNVMASAMAVLVNDGVLDTLTQSVATNGTIDGIDRTDDEYLGWGERLNLIEDETGADRSVSGAYLWATFQQNNGSANAILSSDAVAVRLNGDDGGAAGTDASQTVSTTGRFAADLGTRIVDAATVGSDNDRLNVITDGSFEIAEGVVTVQQNNGDANVVGAAVGVLAVGGGGDADVAQTVEAVGTVSGSRSDRVIDFLSGRGNTIDDGSFDGYRGVFTIQQNNGSANVVGSAIGVAASLPAAGGGSIVSNANVEGTVDTIDTARDVRIMPGLGSTGNSRQNTIDGAFAGVEGAGTVIQNNGSGNVIGSAVAVAAGDAASGSAGTVTNGAAVNGTVVNADSDLTETGSWANHIGNAFTDADGVNTVIQNNGEANAIGVAVAVAAQDAGFGTAMSTTTLNGVVAGTRVAVESWNDVGGTAFTNTIDNGAFAGVSGVTSVIQNNGSGNVIGAAISVTATD